MPFTIQAALAATLGFFVRPLSRRARSRPLRPRWHKPVFRAPISPRRASGHDRCTFLLVLGWPKTKNARDGVREPFRRVTVFFRDDLMLMWEQRRLRGSRLSKLYDVFTVRFVVSVSVVLKPRFKSSGGFPFWGAVRKNIEKYCNVFLPPAFFFCFLFSCNGSIS